MTGSRQENQQQLPSVFSADVMSSSFPYLNGLTEFLMNCVILLREGEITAMDLKVDGIRRRKMGLNWGGRGGDV